MKGLWKADGRWPVDRHDIHVDRQTYVCMYACMHVCMSTYIHAYIDTYKHRYTRQYQHREVLHIHEVPDTIPSSPHPKEPQKHDVGEQHSQMKLTCDQPL